jgi:glycosyltransferase involved in cell wall biosynthesis
MRFSVIIPTYNRSELVKEAIDSVLSQTFKDYELIVVNDGSTDNTKEVLDSYKDKVIAINKENSGAEKSRNAGAEASIGEYLAILDDDDLFFPWTLEVYNKIILCKNNPPFLLGQPLHFINLLPSEIQKNTKQQIKFVSYKDYFSKDRGIYSSSSMFVIKREFFFKLGGFRKYYEKKDFFLDDIEFLLRAGTISPVIIIYEPFLFGYRHHSANSIKNLNRVLNSIKYIIENEHSDKFAGGRQRRFERHAIIGGPAYYWLFKALRNDLYKESVSFFLKSFPFIIKGLLKKIKNSLLPKKEMEFLELK